jgi:hypothetical protein
VPTILFSINDDTIVYPDPDIYILSCLCQAPWPRLLVPSGSTNRLAQLSCKDLSRRHPLKHCLHDGPCRVRAIRLAERSDPDPTTTLAFLLFGIHNFDTEDVSIIGRLQMSGMTEEEQRYS